MALFHVARYAGPEAGGAEADADGRARALLERLQCQARERQRQRQPQQPEPAEATQIAEAAGRRRRRRPRRPRRHESGEAPVRKRRRADGEDAGAEDSEEAPEKSNVGTRASGPRRSPEEVSEPPAHALLLGGFRRSKVPKVQPFLPSWLAEPSCVGKNVTEDLVPVEDIPEVHPDLQRKLRAHGISSYFPVQAAVIPAVLESLTNGFLVGRGGYQPRDLCVSAPTGSGKTLAFVIPVVQALLRRAVCQIRALVVLPTKELAQQVSKVFNIYTDATPLRVALVTGQKPLSKEQESLVQKTVDGFRCLADIVVATPGRLVDHTDQTPGFSLQHLRFLVIDEADRMIDSMHQSWLPRVVAAAFPSETVNDPFALLQRRQPQAVTAASTSCPQMPLQKLLFSATLTQNPEKLQRLGLYQPRLFSTELACGGPRDTNTSVDADLGGKYTFPTGLTHHYVRCSLRSKPLAILHLILKMNFSRVLCFTNSRETSHRLFLLVQAFGGVSVAEFSSRYGPGQRKMILKQFEQGKIQLTRGMGLSSWPGAGSISPHHAPPASSAQTLQLEASTCRLCSLWSTMTPPSTCGPMCIGEGWPLVLGGGPQRETAVPRPLEGWGPHWTGGGLLVFRVGRTARAGKTGQAFTLLLKVQERRFLQMLADAGAPELQRHDSPSELLQPLVPRYEEALSQLERAVKEERKQKAT